MNKQQDNRSLNEKMGDSFNLLLWIVTPLSLVATVFTRFGWGVQGLGTEALFCGLFLPMYAAFMNDCPSMEFWYVWLCFALYRRWTAWEDGHRHSDGYPYFIDMTGGDNLKARVMEAAVVFLIGEALFSVSYGLGLLIGRLCAVSLAVKTSFEIAMYRAEQRLVADARREADRMKEMMGE